MSKDKAILIDFDIGQLNHSYFLTKIITIIPKGFVYTVFIKVRFDLDKFPISNGWFSNLKPVFNLDFILSNK